MVPRFLAFIAPALLAGALQAQVSMTILPDADLFATNGPPGNDRSNLNYGAAGAFGIAAPGKPQGEFQSLLKFNFASSVALFDSTYGPGNWTLQSITLQLTAQNPSAPMFNAQTAGSFKIVWQQNDNWSEGTGTPGVPTMDGVTFSTLPSFQGGGDSNVGTFAFNGATSGTFTYSLQLAAGLAGDVLAGNLVSLRFAAADSNIAVLFNSRSFGTASARPMLTVTAVPEPTTFALLGCGLLSVIVGHATRRAKRCF